MKNDKMKTLIAVLTLKGIIENLEGIVGVLEESTKCTERMVYMESPVPCLIQGVQALKGMVIPLSKTVESVEKLEWSSEQSIPTFEQVVRSLKRAVILLELLVEGFGGMFLGWIEPEEPLVAKIIAIEGSVSSFKGSVATLQGSLRTLKQKGRLNPEEQNSKAKLLKCHECDFKTDCNFVLEHHLESFHTKGKLLVCPRCPFTSRLTQVMVRL